MLGSRSTISSEIKSSLNCEKSSRFLLLFPAMLVKSTLTIGTLKINSPASVNEVALLNHEEECFSDAKCSF